jgi:antitoxin (DNA-binding transcriptional repressor) of toxin-antitoxin stability system
VKKVKIAYAIAHFPELLTQVSAGESIVICRYNTAVAALVPPPPQEIPKRQFASLKGKAAIVDTNSFAPMTAPEADAFVNGRR